MKTVEELKSFDEIGITNVNGDSHYIERLNYSEELFQYLKRNEHRFEEPAIYNTGISFKMKQRDDIFYSKWLQFCNTRDIKLLKGIGID